MALRGLAADEHLVGVAADLAHPPIDEELVADDQDLGRLSRVLLQHAYLRRQAPEAADEGRVLEDCASNLLGGRDHVRVRDRIIGRPLAGVNTG